MAYRWLRMWDTLDIRKFYSKGPSTYSYHHHHHHHQHRRRHRHCICRPCHERMSGLVTETCSFKAQGILGLFHLSLGCPMSLRCFDWNWRDSLGRRTVSIRFRLSNQFLWYVLKYSTAFSIFNLFWMLEFLWQSSILNNSSGLKNHIFAASNFWAFLLFMSQGSASRNRAAFKVVLWIIYTFSYHRASKCRFIVSLILLKLLY